MFFIKLTHCVALAAAITLTPGDLDPCGAGVLTAAAPSWNAQFGYSADIDGDFAVVGAVKDSSVAPLAGAAYVFQRIGSVWTQVAELTASDAEAVDRLGRTVSISGGRVLVGTSFKDNLAGAAYVFENIGGSWVETAKLVASDGAPNEEFGYTVSIDGDTAVVGAYRHPEAGFQSGAVYVFDWDGTAWNETAQLIGHDTAPLDEFGWALHLDGDRLAVGSAHQDLKRGAVYMFERSGGSWNETHKLTHFDAVEGDHLGVSVNFVGDTVVAGVDEDDTAGHRSGSARVFELSGTAWVETTTLVADDIEAGDLFGWSVAMSEDHILVGAPEPVVVGGAGSAYLFERSGTTWRQAARLAPPVGRENDRFGWSVALKGNTALIGAPLVELGSATDAGTVHAFLVAPGVGTTYCTCAAAGPCGNDAGFGCANSTGVGARLTGCGSPSVSADDLVITVSGLAGNQPGLVFMGAGRTSAPFGDGQLCVSGALFRFPTHDPGGSGTITEGPGIVATSRRTFDVSGAITAGSSWHFQGFYRDAGSPCGTAFNTSNALEVSFAP